MGFIYIDAKSFKIKDKSLDCEKVDKDENIWYKEKLLFKKFGLDKVALSRCEYKNSFKKK